MLLFALLLRCHALPPYPRRFNGPALVAGANANARQLPLPPEPGSPVSLGLSVLRHVVGHLKQPWDPTTKLRHPPAESQPPIFTGCASHAAG